MMARFLVNLLLPLALVALTSGCSSGSGGGGMPRSNSGRPFGIDLSDNSEVYPNYDSRHHAVGVGVEVRPNSDMDVRVTGGVGVNDLLGGNLRPQGDVELELRPGGQSRVVVGAGVDASGNPRAHVGVKIPFRKRRSVQDVTYNEEMSRSLFKVFDLNRDGQIDVVDWSAEGGKVLSFAALITEHDTNGDEKISLEEFLQVPILSDLGLDHFVPAPEPANHVPEEAETEEA